MKINGAHLWENLKPILSCQITGVEWPNPGSFIFQKMFSSSDHSFGGFDESGATPFPVTPRHEGQFESAFRVLLVTRIEPSKIKVNSLK